MSRPTKAALAAALSLLALWAAAPASAEVRTVTLRSSLKTLGPYGVKWRTDSVTSPKLDGFVTAMHARVVDAQGRPVPIQRMMLHHVAFTNASRTDEVYCRGKAERFYGTGEEDQSLKLPEGYGYRVRASDRWRMNWMLMNHGNRPDRAFIEYTVTIDTSPDLTHVRPYWLGAVGCLADPIFNVPGGEPAGSSFLQSRTWTIPEGGRIVAAGGHLHGGAKNLYVSQPACDDRRLMESDPTYGQPDHPVYNVLPVLHEPGPVNSSWWSSKEGIPVTAGERLKVTADYDAELPHPRVMGIMHVYVATDPGPTTTQCDPLPADATNEGTSYPGRADPPPVQVPLTGLDRKGRARTIDRPPGAERRLGSAATLPMRRFRFLPRNLSVPLGATLRWVNRDRAPHNVTLANGPRGFGSQNAYKGERIRRRFDVPGTYRIFCSLHPIQMTQVVKVRDR